MLILKKSPMELKSIIGKRKTENGETVRMNKIALEQIKGILSSDLVDKSVMLEYLFGNVYSNDSLLTRAVENYLIANSGRIDLTGIGLRFSVPGYETDHLKGLCEDGDANCIRLIKYDDDGGRVIKKKIGKVVAEALINTILCEQARTYVCEHVAKEWKAYASEHSVKGAYHLVVDDDFDSIYNSSEQIGDFHSCMNGCDGIEFYSEIDASAASLRTEDGMIVARCVVFNEVFDENGNEHRYAERQYSSGQNLTLQKILINKLYAEGYIDLHKRVGASCWDSDNVVDKDGNEFEETLYIVHRFRNGDRCPFMDGFAYYDENSGMLYNNKSERYTEELHNTSGRFGPEHTCNECGCGIEEDDICYSSYHGVDLCDDCAVWSDTLGDYLIRGRAARVYSPDGSLDDYMPDDWSQEDHGYVDVNGRYYWYEDCVFDTINSEHILAKNSVEYNYKCGAHWYSEYTHLDEIGYSIVEFEDEYWLMDDCEEVDGVWYPCDQVPEDVVEEE